MLTSRTLAPPGDLIASDGERPFVVFRQDQPGELLRAGDVSPLADHREVALGTDASRVRVPPAGCTRE